jgi:hypothetical protein
MLDLKQPERPAEDTEPQPPAPAPEGYTSDEEAEVQKRLEDLGYI